VPSRSHPGRPKQTAPRPAVADMLGENDASMAGSASQLHAERCCGERSAMCSTGWGAIAGVQSRRPAWAAGDRRVMPGMMVAPPKSPHSSCSMSVQPAASAHLVSQVLQRVVCRVPIVQRHSKGVCAISTSTVVCARAMAARDSAHPMWQLHVQGAVVCKVVQHACIVHLAQSVQQAPPVMWQHIHAWC
jgi:hypothetical protein